MKLTSKGRYAVTAMLDLALFSTPSQPVSLADIAKRQCISLAYLEQLFSKLRRSELVQSVRGPGGGYFLHRVADEIFIADIIHAVDEQIEAMNCGGKGNCKKGEMCLTHHLWQDLSEQINDFLSGISLAMLMENRQAEDIPLTELSEHVS